MIRVMMCVSHQATLIVMCIHTHLRYGYADTLRVNYFSTEELKSGDSQNSGYEYWAEKRRYMFQQMQ
jgi:hypothetical protein